VSGRSNPNLAGRARCCAAGTLAVSTGGAPTLYRGTSFRAPSGGIVEPMIRAKPDDVSQPSGAGPAQIEGACGLDTSPCAGAGQAIAIVDAYDDPALDVYMTSANWGLPLCGTSGFTKVDQNGGTNYPSPAPSGWALETALDVEWAHALAPGAHIMLVEADGADGPDFFSVERYAGAHAGYVLNSWGHS
jgi:hypothetical protein